MTCPKNRARGDCGKNREEKLIAEFSDKEYTKEMCHNLCASRNPDLTWFRSEFGSAAIPQADIYQTSEGPVEEVPVLQCRQCAGYSVGITKETMGRCSLYTSGCLQNEPDSRWQYYGIDDCSYEGNSNLPVVIMTNIDIILVEIYITS